MGTLSILLCNYSMLYDRHRKEQPNSVAYCIISVVILFVAKMYNIWCDIVFLLQSIIDTIDGESFGYIH